MGDSTISWALSGIWTPRALASLAPASRALSRRCYEPALRPGKPSGTPSHHSSADASEAVGRSPGWNQPSSPERRRHHRFATCHLRAEIPCKLCDNAVVNIFRTRGSSIPAPEQALPGRDESITVPERHIVLGTPLVPPFPE